MDNRESLTRFKDHGGAR